MAFARWVEAEEEITQHGVVVKEPCFDKLGMYVGDRLKKNPACTAAMASQKEMRALLALFGMDPSSNSRIHSGGDEAKLSPLMAMLKARQEGKTREPKTKQPARQNKRATISPTVN
jgi:P27 family predicted phage terminase small subunit